MATTGFTLPSQGTVNRGGGGVALPGQYAPPNPYGSRVAKPVPPTPEQQAKLKKKRAAAAKLAADPSFRGGPNLDNLVSRGLMSLGAAKQVKARHAKAMDRSHLKPTGVGVQGFHDYITKNYGGKVPNWLKDTAALVESGAGIDDYGIASGLARDAENMYQYFAPQESLPNPVASGQLSTHDAGGFPEIGTGNRRIDNYTRSLARKGVNPELAGMVSAPYGHLVKDSPGSALGAVLTGLSAFSGAGAFGSGAGVGTGFVNNLPAAAQTAVRGANVLKGIASPVGYRRPVWNRGQPPARAARKASTPALANAPGNVPSLGTWLGAGGTVNKDAWKGTGIGGQY